jgi:hypothetical protein
MIQKTDTCVTILFKNYMCQFDTVFIGHKSDQKVTCDLSAAKLNTKTACPIQGHNNVLPHLHIVILFIEAPMVFPIPES